MNTQDVLKDVASAIRRSRRPRQGETLVVAVSGGPDSLCLLHALTQLRTEFDLTLHVAHLHHGLRGADADADAGFVSDLAESWGLPVTVERCDVPALAAKEGMAIEETARQARYAFLGRVAVRIGAGSIAVGHNADDQTETILMHWLRGAGLAGLRGMLPATPLSGMRLFDSDQELVSTRDILVVRLLLDTPRTAIEAYCRAHDLEPRFDRSNLDTTYFRNRLRHELIPQLETYNPNIREVVRRGAHIITDDYELLRTLSTAAWDRVVTDESERVIKFDLSSWRDLAVSLQRSTIREAIHRLRRSLRNINLVHIENAITALRDRPVSTRVTLPDGLTLIISYDHFVVADSGYVEPTDDYPQLLGGEVPVSMPGSTLLPSSPWRVESRLIHRDDGYEEEHVGNPDPWQAYVDLDQTGHDPVIRCRLPGEVFRPLGLKGHRQRIRDFMINAKIPRHVRQRFPVIASSQGVIWIPGYRIDRRVRITGDTRRIVHLVVRRSSDKQGHE